MTEPINVNRAAPLRNVASFLTLLTKMVDRHPKLPGLAVYFGPSGWGKTESAVLAANKFRAAYVECGMFTTARSLLSMILLELGEQHPRGSIEEMKGRAIELMAADPRRPLIVDEAHFVFEKRFGDVLRELSDKSGAAVILIGEEVLPAKLEKFERVHNRVLEWLPAEPCDAGDFGQLAKLHLPGVTVAADIAHAILATTEGNTRRIVTNLTKAAEIVKLGGLKSIDLAAFGGAAAIVGRRTIMPRQYR